MEESTGRDGVTDPVPLRMCPGFKCSRSVVVGRVFCSRCWDEIRGELRDRVADTWEAPNAHYRAIGDAVKWLEESRRQRK